MQRDPILDGLNARLVVMESPFPLRGMAGHFN
jgi:hypothetical protein